MGMKLEAFDRELRLMVEDLEPEAAARRLAAYARECIADYTARNGFAPIRTIVDGRVGASEDAVRCPGGKIVYEFDYWPEIIQYALSVARLRSPVSSGAYRDSWIVLVNDRDWDGGAVPPGAEVIVVNDKPYARKIHVGAMEMTLPPGIVEDIRQIVQRAYGRLIRAEVSFVQLRPGYILKGRQPVRFAKRTQIRRRRSHRDIIAGQTILATRPDTRAGEAMTYPALVMREIR
jgi:hypothetical protein